MTRARRMFSNIFDSWFQLRRRFPGSLLDEMAIAIGTGESTHLGEVCFAVEPRLSPWVVMHGADASTRARQVFAQLRVWDTELNSGVLFYVLLAEHRVEILADRGIAARVEAAEWDAICSRMTRRFADGQWREGSLEGIAAAHALLALHFPAQNENHRDELSNRPVLL